MTTREVTRPSTETTVDRALPTTAGVIAIGNLWAQIDGLEREAAAGRLTVRARADLTDLISLRGHLLGRIADHERAETMAERLTRVAPADGDARLTRARMLATFHRFTAALADLDEADRLGADHALVAGERAAVFQAVGRYDEALAICREAVERRPDFSRLGALAVVHAERGDVAAAETCFAESRGRYRGVSPLPLAQLEFRRARMWLAEGDLPRARTWLETAVRRLPAYAPAAGHLAEVEDALGETGTAIARLLPLASSSDDPDYAAQLARILGDAGRPREAAGWRSRAARRYDELVSRHGAAYADHAAEFWLDAGADPHRALSLATSNVEVRPTERAHALAARAARAASVVTPSAAPRAAGDGRWT